MYLVTETGTYERYVVVKGDKSDCISLVDSPSSFELPGGLKLIGKVSYKIEEANQNDYAIKQASRQLEDEPKEEKVSKKLSKVKPKIKTKLSMAELANKLEGLNDGQG